MTMESSRWFGQGRRQPDRVFTLFCLPYSGAGASMFFRWQRAFDPRVEIMPVHLPGREDRIGEPLGHFPDAVAAAIARQADRPYAIYGHSLGARLGYEVIRALRRLGAPPPVRFYPAAGLPPDVAWPFADCVELPDEEFLAVLAERINPPAEAWEIPELRELVLPVLRADFEWIARYRHDGGPSLGVPVIGVAGADDLEAGPLAMLGWSRHTSASFRLHTLPGDHFFVRSATAELARLLGYDLLNGADPRLSPPAADEVHLWLADLDELHRACAAWGELSPREALRASQIRDAEDQRRYIGRCAVLRRILGRYGDGRDTDELAADAEMVRRESGLRLSAARSGPLVLAGVAAARDIGVDIERAVDITVPGDEGVTRVPLPGATGVIRTRAGGWRMRFEVVTEAMR